MPGPGLGVQGGRGEGGGGEGGEGRVAAALLFSGGKIHLALRGELRPMAETGASSIYTTKTVANATKGRLMFRLLLVTTTLNGFFTLFWN